MGSEHAPRVAGSIGGTRFVLVFAALIVMGIAAIGTLAVRRQHTVATLSGAHMLDEAIERYRADHGAYPTPEQGLRVLVDGRDEDAYVDPRVLVDPWGRPYRYEVPGRRNPDRFDVYSLGRDGRPGGTDSDRDLGNFPVGE